ncbi:hypothetical protein AB0B68_19890 [Micromonospora sp. NPDC049049]|uniref:hypothetical protein n=1 Tax=Micromonospora sp. NPDC049049 TaxID=3155495 RepID=UPI00340503E1
MFRRRLSAATVVVAVAAGALVAPSPALAYTNTQIPASSWAYTDSATPTRATVNAQTDAPIGRWLDAEENSHTSRFYFSISLAELAGRQLSDADLIVREKKVTDCGKAAAVELWRTAGFANINSWKKPPVEQEKLGTMSAGGAGAECPGSLVQDLTSTVQAALARGETRLHLELRLNAEAERDERQGRWLYYRPTLSVQHNGLPTIGNLSLYPNKGCGDATHPVTVGGGWITFSAKASDPDPNDWADVYFAAWPVDHPDQRRERGGSSYGSGQEHRTEWEMSSYPHGTVLAWTARATDGDGDSGWAPLCYVRVDGQAPAEAPQVSSAEYPANGAPGSGGVGVPGTFRFDAGGDTDVTRYRYDDPNQGTTVVVDAPAPGAAATFTWTPERSGPMTMRVRSLDAVGNASPPREYEFWVRHTEPSVQVDVAGTHLPSTLTMRSPVAEVTSFGYRIDSGEEVRVPATEAAATATVTFTEARLYQLVVSAYIGDKLSGSGRQSVSVNDAPKVESTDFAWDHNGVVGVEGTFSFRPRTTDVVAYRYAFGYDEETRIAAAADGTASLAWTPQAPNYYQLHVRSERADGTLSQDTGYEFSVVDNKPTVYSSDVDGSPRRDGLGLPMSFHFSTSMPDVAEFVYQFDGEAERTVSAEYGTARLTWTPDRAGDREVTVRSRYTSGQLSPPAVWPFAVWTGPVVRSAAYESGSSDGRVGKEATFTFQPGLPGVQRYTYQLNWGQERTVDAGADGMASVTYTPSESGYQTIEVTSHGADGTRSQTRTYEFVVKSDRVGVAGWYSDWSVTGGIGVPGSMTFWTDLYPDVAEYRYRLNDGPEQTVAADPDGTGTGFLLTPDRNGVNTLSVRQLLRSGELSPATEYRFRVGTAPLVTSAEYPAGQWSGGAGQAGRFTFSGGTTGIVEFEYQVGEDDARVVPAVDGTATVSWTPPYWTSYTMTVRGRLANGTWTDSSSYNILVQP